MKWAFGIDSLRVFVGFIIIVSHLYCFFIILSTDALSTISERVELSLLIGPMFAVYVAAIVRKLVSLMNFPWDSSVTHPAFAFLATGTGLIFAMAVPWALLQFVNQNIPTLEDLKMTLGILETALGVYTGAIIDALFGLPKSVEQS